MTRCTSVALSKLEVQQKNTVLDHSVAYVALVALFSISTRKKREEREKAGKFSRIFFQASATTATSATALAQPVFLRCTSLNWIATELQQAQAGAPWA